MQYVFPSCCCVACQQSRHGVQMLVCCVSLCCLPCLGWNWHEALTALRWPMWEYSSSELMIISALALNLILPVVAYTAVAQVLYLTTFLRKILLTCDLTLPGQL